MAKKKVGPARPEKWIVTIEGGKPKDAQSYLGDQKEAVEKATLHFGGRVPKLIRIHTSRRRSQVQSGRMLRYRRTVGWVFQRTFTFE